MISVLVRGSVTTFPFFLLRTLRTIFTIAMALCVSLLPPFILPPSVTTVGTAEASEAPPEELPLVTSCDVMAEDSWVAEVIGISGI